VIVGVIVYRVIMSVLFQQWNTTRSGATIYLTVTAAILNLAVIMTLAHVYERLARSLTEWEYPRTQRQFENSFTFKVYLFEFINYYSFLFSIAFFKGRYG
jgi:NhaP-type Na+/H+ or K+/H+ antiporter